MIPEIDALTQAAAEHAASDLFLSAGEIPRVRVGGEIAELNAPALSTEVLADFWTTCGGDPAATLEHDAGFVDTADNRFRVALYRHMGGLAAVLRHIKSDIPSFDALGLPGPLLTDWTSRPSGLVLITGATGSGKSTSLAACLDWINQHHARHIVTIEDPIEYTFENKQAFFSQREVGTDTTSFAKGLRASLRQSPDVILVGEIRDSETAATALQAAETGHLVLSTLHSRSVTDTLERLTNIFPPSERESALLLLSTQIIGILSQKLLPGVDGSMQVVVEHLLNEGATREWVREMKLAEIEDHLRRSGAETNRAFIVSLVEAVQAGRLDAEVAAEASPNAGDFRRALRGIT